MKPEKKITATEIYSLAFGLFLGLALWKFGNPVILEHNIIPPSTPSEFWNDAWPTHWASWILLPLALAGALIAFKQNFRRARVLASRLVGTLAPPRKQTGSGCCHFSGSAGSSFPPAKPWMRT